MTTKKSKPNGVLLKRFLYWMTERHSIYKKRAKGASWPWTKDPILKEYKFTNVFRLLDRVTQCLVSQVLKSGDFKRASYGDKLFMILLFRMFNWPETYRDLAMANLHKKWNVKQAIKVLKHRATMKRQVFTGAYIITNNGSTRPKIELVCEALDALHKDRKKLANEIRKTCSVEHAVNLLSTYPMIGQFIAYELACDLTYTPEFLKDAKDRWTWANPGPGAKRGLNRIYCRSLKESVKTEQLIEEMRELMPKAQKALKEPLELRDIEHSLCEFDKYMRVANGEGRPRAKYNYKPQPEGK